MYIDYNGDPKNEETIGGLRANALAFIVNISFFLGFGIFASIAVLILEKENKFVRFYAKQVIALSIISIITITFNLIILLGYFLFILSTLIIIILQIISTIKSINGNIFEIPYLSRLNDILFVD